MLPGTWRDTIDTERDPPSAPENGRSAVGSAPTMRRILAVIALAVLGCATRRLCELAVIAVSRLPGKRFRIGAVLLAAAAVLVITPVAAARGGSGTVSVDGVGPLLFDISSPSDLRDFAGRPDRVTFWDQNGAPTISANASWEIWQYHYPNHGYTWYSFNWDGSEWVLEEFDTTLERFHTARGTRVGMSYAEARRCEHRTFSGGCIDAGLWHIRRQNGQLYSLVVGVNPGQPVHALHSFGPSPLPC